MDKKLILAVAGSGKTTYIVNSLDSTRRSLIITYTNSNYDNLQRKILEKFNNKWPENITLLTYFVFLYRFCYKPLLSDKHRVKGINFKNKDENRYNVCQKQKRYYITEKGYVYSNRLSLLLEKCNAIESIVKRLEKYYDEFIIDEVQDIGGRDFNFLLKITKANINMLFVGDFYQHTYDTSRDGNTNKNLFLNFDKYISNFKNEGFIIDNETLVKSWRCGENICNFVNKKLGILIKSNKNNDNEKVYDVRDKDQIKKIWNDDKIVKLHYNNSSKYGRYHRNWADTKGEDCYQDVCVLLNKKTMNLYLRNNLQSLANQTKNKLYVAITRAHGSVYLIEEQKAIDLIANSELKI